MTDEERNPLELAELFSRELKRTEPEDGEGYVTVTFHPWNGEILIRVGQEEATGEVTDGVNGMMDTADVLAEQFVHALRMVEAANLPV